MPPAHVADTVGDGATPLIADRQAVLELYAEARKRRWVIPCFCSENLTTTEAVLAAVKAHGEKLGADDLPVTLGMTNQYAHRTNSAYYTHTRRWDVGLRLFLADLKVLTGGDSPFGGLRVMVHLDHAQHDADRELLGWDMRPFSSIMFDASTLPLAENIRETRAFVEKRGGEIVVEGACDEIVDATGSEVSALTTPASAERYLAETGVDFLVANLGTEHRANAADLKYHGDLARRIAARVGLRIVLHGCSSVAPEQVRNLFGDGVCKVNLWTALERDTAPLLLAEMAANASRIAGPARARAMHNRGLLGDGADLKSPPSLRYYPTCYRQDIIFREMTRIVAGYLGLWYR